MPMKQMLMSNPSAVAGQLGYRLLKFQQNHLNLAMTCVLFLKKKALNTVGENVLPVQSVHH